MGKGTGMEVVKGVFVAGVAAGGVVEESAACPGVGASAAVGAEVGVAGAACRGACSGVGVSVGDGLLRQDSPAARAAKAKRARIADALPPGLTRIKASGGNDNT